LDDAGFSEYSRYNPRIVAPERPRLYPQVPDAGGLFRAYTDFDMRNGMIFVMMQITGVRNGI
jgi:hypothetical protein